MLWLCVLYDNDIGRVFYKFKKWVKINNKECLVFVRDDKRLNF